MMMKMHKAVALLAFAFAGSAWAQEPAQSLTEFKEQVSQCVAQSDSNPACFEELNQMALNFGVSEDQLALCTNAADSNQYSNCMIETAGRTCIGRVCFGRDHDRDRWGHDRDRWGRDCNPRWDRGCRGRWDRRDPWDRDRRWDDRRRWGDRRDPWDRDRRRRWGH